MEELKLVKYDGKFWNTLYDQINDIYGGKSTPPKEEFKVKFQRFLQNLKDTFSHPYSVYIRKLQEAEELKKQAEQYVPQVFDVELRDLTPLQVEQYRDGNFVINGTNSTETIRNLEYLTGLSISELEARMLPDDRKFDELKDGEYYGSSSEFRGFLKEDERLIDILGSDNDAVLAAGLTHQDVAKPMLQILNARIHYPYSFKDIVRCEINGTLYENTCAGFPMFQDSPFNDGISAPGFNITVKNSETGKKMFFAPLVPLLIHRYGFYEGDVHYRIDPKKAIEFFH